MQGGELFSFIQERAESAFTERGKFSTSISGILLIENL